MEEKPRGEELVRGKKQGKKDIRREGSHVTLALPGELAQISMGHQLQGEFVDDVQVERRIALFRSVAILPEYHVKRPV